MLRPPHMAAARRFVLRHEAETDLGVLCDSSAVEHASLLTGESVVLDATAGTAIDTLLVPFVNLGMYSVGVVVLSSAGFQCGAVASVDEAGVEQTLDSPIPDKLVGRRAFSGGRYIRDERNGEILYVLSDLRGRLVDTVSLISVGPPYGPDGRARETTTLFCDAVPFAAGRLIDSVVSYSHTVRWQTGAPPAQPHVPANALDLSSNIANMACYAGTTDVFVVPEQALVGADGKLRRQQPVPAAGVDPRVGGRRVLTSFVDSLAHGPSHVLRAYLMSVAVQSRAGEAAPVRWGMSPMVDTYATALENATRRVGALRVGAEADEDALFSYAEDAAAVCCGFDQVEGEVVFEDVADKSAHGGGAGLLAEAGRDRDRYGAEEEGFAGREQAAQFPDNLWSKSEGERDWRWVDNVIAGGAKGEAMVEEEGRGVPRPQEVVQSYPGSPEGALTTGDGCLDASEYLPPHATGPPPTKLMVTPSMPGVNAGADLPVRDISAVTVEERAGNVGHADGMPDVDTAADVLFRSMAGKSVCAAPPGPPAVVEGAAKEEDATKRRERRRRANIEAAKRSNAKRKAAYDELVQALALAKEVLALLRRREATLREENEVLRIEVRLLV